MTQDTSQVSHSDDEMLQHHAGRLTAKVIDDDPHRVLKAWIDGMDEEDADELVDSIYGAVCDEIVATLEQPEFEADMDDRIDAFSVSDRGEEL